MSDVITHKCPNCDGPLTYSPSDELFTCDYCLSEFTVADIASFEEPEEKNEALKDTVVAAFEENLSEETQASADTSQREDEMHTAMSLFTCPSCGAEIVTDETTAATHCYYCHNPVILSGRVSGEFLPRYILPFKVSEEEAKKTFIDWGRKKWFARKNFFSSDQIESITGVYFPYWLVKADIQATWEGSAKDIRVWRVGETEYTQTKVYDLFRAGHLNFDQLVKNALKKNTPLAMVESVQPFDVTALKPFHTEYLSGFQADKRDLSYEALQESIRADLHHYTSAMLEATANHVGTITSGQAQIQTMRDQGEYCLLPVWLITYQNERDPEKHYYFAMNGHSGKTSGQLPINKLRLSLFSLFAGSIVFILLVIVGYFLW